MTQWAFMSQTCSLGGTPLISLQRRRAGMPSLGLSKAAVSRCCCGSARGQGTCRGPCQRREVFGADEASVSRKGRFGGTEPSNPCSSANAPTHTGLPLLVSKEDKFPFMSPLFQTCSLQESETHLLYQLLITRASFPLSKDHEFLFVSSLSKTTFRKRI